MTDDERQHTLETFLAHVRRVATSSPSLDAFYELESDFVYSDFWIPARDEFQKLFADRPERALAWRDELCRLPSDLALWLPSYDRRRGTELALQQAAAKWSAAEPERYFAAHHHVGSVSELAALQVALGAGIAPVSAIEFAAKLPNELFVWGAVRHLQFHDHPELIERVLVESSSSEAVLLCLACELDTQCESMFVLTNKRRPGRCDSGDIDKAIETTWADTLPRRFALLARAVLARSDANAVVGPWLRHLVSLEDRVQAKDLSRVAKVARTQLLAAIPNSSLGEIARAASPDAACVVARMLVATQRGRVADEWLEWASLVCREDRSLAHAGPIYWGAAGDVLRRRSDPLAAWLDAVRQLEPVLRTRARRIERGMTDPGVHLVMSAINAAAMMKENGRPLWFAAFERARRHFLVDSPPKAEPGYYLTSYVFGAFPRVFGEDKAKLEEMLALLPTSEHVENARMQFARNATI